MFKSHKKPHFPHFLRKWSESVRTTMLSSFEALKSGLSLSTFIFIAEKLRKNRKVCLLFPKFNWENENRNIGLLILFLLIPNNL
jgi:hypothetical protein